MGGGPWRAGALGGRRRLRTEPYLPSPSPPVGEGGGRGRDAVESPCSFSNAAPPGNPGFPVGKLDVEVASGPGDGVARMSRAWDSARGARLGTRGLRPGDRGLRADGKPRALRKQLGEFGKSGFRRPGAQPPGRVSVCSVAGALRSPRTSEIITAGEVDVEVRFNFYSPQKGIKIHSVSFYPQSLFSLYFSILEPSLNTDKEVILRNLAKECS